MAVFDSPSLDGREVSVTEMSNRRAEVQAPQLSQLTIERAGVLTVEVRTDAGTLLLRETSSHLLIARDCGPEATALIVCLWAADQLRSVWSIWRHLLNGI
jgi:hypothetical protein